MLQKIVVIVGNGAVGKSSMIQKYCKGVFTSEYKKTIGVDFLEKRIWQVHLNFHNSFSFSELTIKENF